MIKTCINLSKRDFDFIKNADSKKAWTTRINKQFRKYGFDSINQFLDTVNDNSLIRCAFCGKTTKVKSFEIHFKNNILYVSNIVHYDKVMKCRRPDTSKQCSGTKLNNNSIEYVRKTLGFNNDEEARQYLYERNSSPFYRVNYESDDAYSKAQSRGIDFFKSKEKYENYCKRQAYTNSLDYYKEKYGIYGERKWLEYNKSKDSSSLLHFIRKYGSVKGKEEYDKRGKTLDSSSLNFFIKKYGIEIGTKKFEYKHTLEYYIKTYGEENGNRIFNFRKIQSEKVPQQASSESLVNVFLPLLERIKKYNINFYLGYGGSSEYMLFDIVDNKRKFFDFCIPDIKLIVEYHGSIWHYNKNYDYSYLNKENVWRALPTVNEMKHKDAKKRDLAKRYGYTYIEVFDTDNFLDRINVIYDIIKNRLKDKNET